MALARALAKRPKVLLLDEPLGALDKKLREETQFELIDLQDELGLTFVIVTHDQEEAMTVADRISVMDHGKIVQIATPAEIYEAPNSRYVADFIGSVNLFEGDGRQRPAPSASSSRRRTGSPIRADEREPRAPQGQTAWFAVRPEKVRIGHDAPADAAVNAVAGEVLGHRLSRRHDALQRAARRPGKLVRASLMNAERTVERPITWEDKVWLSWAPDAGVVLAKLGGLTWPSAASIPLQRRIVTWIPYLWLLVFFLAPFLIVLKISLSQVVLGQPPYVPVFDSLAEIPEKIGELSFDNYAYFVSDPLYWKAYLSSVWIAGDLDADRAPDRLSDRLRHGAGAAARSGRSSSCWSSCRSGPRS